MQTSPRRESRGPTGRSGRPYSWAIRCPNRLRREPSRWLTISSREGYRAAVGLQAEDRGGGAGGLCRRPSTDGVLPTAGRNKPQGWARGCTGPAAASAATQEPGGSRSQALRHAQGSASATAVAGKAAVVGPRGNAPQPSTGPRQVSGGGEDRLHTSGEEPDLKFGAATKNY